MPYSLLKQKRSTRSWRLNLQLEKSGLRFNSLSDPIFNSIRLKGIDPVKLPTSKVQRLLSLLSMPSLRELTLLVFIGGLEVKGSFYGACSSFPLSLTSASDTCSSCDLKLKGDYCHWAEKITWNQVWSKCQLPRLSLSFFSYTLRMHKQSTSDNSINKI